MDQVKIGLFIQQMRKDAGMTQKELAERLQISDKTVSKWETGKGVPDVESLNPLCQIFSISVNELLSGEKLPPSEYTKKAEDNILSLLEENTAARKRNVISIIMGVVLLLAGMMMFFGFTCSHLIWYLDLPSLLMPVCLCGAVVLLSGKRTAREVISLLRKIVIPVGLIDGVGAVICIMAVLDDTSTIGPNLAIAVLSVLYTLIAYVVLVVLEERRK